MFLRKLMITFYRYLLKFEFHFQVINTKNIFIQGENSEFITSKVVILSVAKKGGEKIKMKSTETKFYNDQNGTLDRTLDFVTPKFTEGDADQLFYHSITQK